jgi:poly(3-hydroxybutyrate) depolymerase
VTTRRALLAGLAATLLVPALPGVAAEPGSDARLDTGSGSFQFAFVAGGAPRSITVWYYQPAEAKADTPIVFVLHGQARNASTYRKYWIPFAEKQRFVLLVPEFSESEFPGNRGYNFGYMRAEDGARYPDSQWSYTAIEALFDRVREANGFTQPAYDIYGHSAGGQFLHRMLMLKPEARFRVAIAANAGWYMMPDDSIAYPHGLRDSGVNAAQLARALSRRLIVLLGDADVDTEHRQLNRSAGASAQGTNRLERGQAFIERAKRAATTLGVPLAWRLELAPGVAHSNARMAPHAARFVAGGERSLAGSSSTDQSASTTGEAASLRR